MSSQKKDCGSSNENEKIQIQQSNLIESSDSQDSQNNFEDQETSFQSSQDIPSRYHYIDHHNNLYFFQELQVIQGSSIGREDLNKGDKMLLPASALSDLSYMLDGSSPMIFCIQNQIKHTYCGVKQFVAQQGSCVIPDWMYKMLKFKPQMKLATVTLVTDLKKGLSKLPYFIKMQPHLTKFIDLPNPKAILQFQLRNFTCLHEGATITVQTFQDSYQIDILEVRPTNDYKAICIVDIDLQVDFAPPLDYQQPQMNSTTVTFIQNSGQKKKKGTFKGKGKRIDEKTPKAKQLISPKKIEEQYDPRKHRIKRGVRKAPIYLGNPTKLD